MKSKLKALIEKLKDQEHKVDRLSPPGLQILSEEQVSFNIRVIGTIFISLSGILLYLDRILIFFNIESGMTFGFSTFGNFIWAFTQSIAPILMIIGFYLKPFKASFLVAIYCYAVQMIGIFSPQYSDDFLISTYSATGLCIIVVFLIWLIKKSILLFTIQKNQDEEFIIEAKDVLELLKSKILEGSKIPVE